MHAPDGSHAFVAEGGLELRHTRRILCEVCCYLHVLVLAVCDQVAESYLEGHSDESAESDSEGEGGAQRGTGGAEETDRQETDRQADGQTDKQTERQTHGQTGIYVYTTHCIPVSILRP